MSARDNRTQEKPTEVSLPITPMLDMAFQLMFFFLATFNPTAHKKEGQMDLSLPSKSDAAASTPEKQDPRAESHKEEIDIPSKITISMRSHKDGRARGKLSALTVQTDTSRRSVEGNEDQRQAALLKLLEDNKPKDAADPTKPKKPVSVKLESDKDMLWQEIVKIMDVCYKAGYQVSFVKPLDLGEADP
jgi:biopolymer transport protein ExbD